MGLIEKVTAAKKKDTVLVIPTIREPNFNAFMQQWEKTGLFDRVDLIVVEDNWQKSFNVPTADSMSGACHHIAWEDIDVEFRWAKNVIPRRSDTVRSFGYWVAWMAGYEYLMTLDDDCYPITTTDYIDLRHKESLKPRTKWFNTLTNGRPRGLPYKNLGRQEVMLNHGLWTEVLDMDAPTQLVDPFDDKHDGSSRIVSPGFYFPFCGMNWMCRREVIVLMYHLLMGRMFVGPIVLDPSYQSPKDLIGEWGPQQGNGPVTFQLPLDRFGDIWCGIIAKKLIDSRGWLATTGTPYVRHSRASDPFSNLRKEANGIALNEKFWEMIDSFDTRTDIPLEQDYWRLGAHVEENAEMFPIEFRGYFIQLGKSMQTWAKLFMGILPEF